MKRNPKVLMVALFSVALLIGACGGDSTEPLSTGGTSTGTASIAGRYNCLQPGSTEPDVAELRSDGRLTITQRGQTFEGKWTVEGNAGAFNPGTAEEDKFTVQDGKIVFTDGATCTRVTGGQAASMAGTYACAPDPRPTDPNWPGPETWLLAEDGKLTIRGPGDGIDEGTPGTWRVDQKQIVINIENEEGRFNISGTSFVGVQEHPAGGKLTCTKQG